MSTFSKSTYLSFLFLLVAGPIAVNRHAKNLAFMYEMCVLGIEDRSTLIGHDSVNECPCFNSLYRATKIQCQIEEYWDLFSLR